MQLSTILLAVTPLLTSVAGSALPVLETVQERDAAPTDVTILGVTAIGTGCPKGHAEVLIDATRTVFDVSFDQYAAVVGKDTKPGDHRKNCKVGVNLKFPPGYQYSIIDTTFYGYASLQQGQTGQCQATYSFAGNPGNSVSWSKVLPGPYEKDYQLYAPVGVISWSPCGQSGILNVNSEVKITPPTSKLDGYMNVDSVDGKVSVKYAVQWRKCKA